MEQLADLVQRNADILPVVAAGFVGAYGEWHTSEAHLDRNGTGLAQVVGSELSWFLPKSTRVQLRTPKWKLSVLRDWAPRLPEGSPERNALAWCLAPPSFPVTSADLDASAC